MPDRSLLLRPDERQWGRMVRALRTAQQEVLSYLGAEEGAGAGALQAARRASSVGVACEAIKQHLLQRFPAAEDGGGRPWIASTAPARQFIKRTDAVVRSLPWATLSKGREQAEAVRHRPAAADEPGEVALRAWRHAAGSGWRYLASQLYDVDARLRWLTGTALPRIASTADSKGFDWGRCVSGLWRELRRLRSETRDRGSLELLGGTEDPRPEKWSDAGFAREIAKCLVARSGRIEDGVAYPVRALRAALSTRLPLHIAESYLLHDVRRRFMEGSQVTSADTAAASELLRAFNSLPESADDVAEQLRSATASPAGPTCPPAADGPGCRRLEAFLDFLELSGVIRYRLRHHSYRKVSGIGESYGLQSLLGWAMDIPGIEHALSGGMMVGSHGSVCLVGGPPGAGKSTLSLQMGASFARHGAVCLYYSLESSAEQLRAYCDAHDVFAESAARVSWPGDPKVDDRLGDALAEATARQVGMMYFGTLENWSMVTLGQDLGIALDQVQALEPRPTVVVVVDSLDAVGQPPVEGPSEAKPDVRESLSGLVRTLRARSDFAVVVAELDSRTATAARDYICDQVWLLQRRPADEHGVRQRELWVQKSRQQKVWEGQLPIAIDPGVGVRVIPSVQGLLDLRARRRWTASTAPVRVPTLPGLRLLLGDQEIPLYTTMALIGPRSLRKGTVGLHCVLGRPAQESAQQVLVLDFAGDPSGMVRRLQKDPALAERYRELLLLKAIHLESLPPSLMSADELLDVICGLLMAAKARGTPYTAVLVDDISRLTTSFPRAGTALTLATLLAVLRTESITAFVTYSIPDGENDALAAVLRAGADTILCFYRLDVRGQYRIGLAVEASSREGHSTKMHELVEREGRLTVTDSLGRYTGLKKLEAQEINIDLFLHAETTRQQGYNERVTEELRIAHGDRVAYRPIQPWMGEHVYGVVNRNAEVPKDRLLVFTLDEHEIRALCGQPGQEPRLEPLAGRLVRSFPERLQKRAWSSQGPVGVPYYCNLSLLAYRPAALSELDVEPEALEAAVELGWRAIHRLVMPRAEAVAERYRLFSCPRVRVQNLLVLLLDVASDCAGRDWGGCLCSLLSNTEAVREACEIAADLTALAATAPQKDDTVVAIPSDAALFWSWASVLPVTPEMNPFDADAQGLRVSRMPGGGWTGDWYLAIGRRSLGVDEGEDIIADLTTETEDLARFRAGVGLPTRETTYQAAMTILGTPAQDFRELHESAYSRGEMACYTQAISDLMRFVLAALGSSRPTAARPESFVALADNVRAWAAAAKREYESASICDSCRSIARRE